MSETLETIEKLLFMIFVYSELTVVFYYCLFEKKKNCNLYPLSTLLYLIGTDLLCVF